MVDKDAVRRGYDDIAEAYAAERTEDGPDTDIISGFLASLTDRDRILDAGCGRGTPLLDRSSTRVAPLGVDLSHEQLELASENSPTHSLVQGDMTMLPVRDDAVDGIIAYHSLIHVPIEEHRSVIDEFARVLRPGGRVLITEGPEEWSGTNPDWLDTGVEMQWHIAGARATRTHLRSAGFTITREWDGTDAADDEHWVIFSARLDS